MKVSTDGVLLGAWACTGNHERVLDIGTGTGVLAIIAAQRYPKAWIDAVEVDSEAAMQAAGNAAASPWADRIGVHLADIRDWTAGSAYGLVLCNPPFYKGHHLPKDSRIATAKHEGTLDLADLLDAMDRHCAISGRACLLLPIARYPQLETLASVRGFHISRLCAVRHKETKQAKRVLVELVRGIPVHTKKEELAVQLASGEYSPEYQVLLKDLELHA